MKPFDVYAFGTISSSTLHLLDRPFPPADGYAEIAETHSMTGGEACNSAIVLSRLGMSVKLDGTWLGDTPDGQWLLETLDEFQIDTSRLKVKKGYEGVREIVFSDDRSRTVFGNYIDLLFTTRRWNIPRKADLAHASMACIDPFFGEESHLAGKYAREAEVPYVTIDCPYSLAFSRKAVGVIISGEFRDHEYPGADLMELFEEYQQQLKGLVIFTCGSEKIIYGRKGEVAGEYRAYPIEVIDTAGAGDAFRAGIIYGLLKGWQDKLVVRYASALAAIICTRFPGVLDSPTHEEVMAFIQQSKS
jgi:sugar/nucleoside kinase (ribokinase family)